MKKTTILIILLLILPNKSFSKILEVGSNSLDVPNKFYLYNWSNSSFNGQLNLCSDEFVNCFGLIDKKLKEIMTRLDSGESFEDTGIDGCYDFYEIGDGQCLPFEFQTDPNILVDICNNYYDCGQVSFSDCENGFDSNFNDISKYSRLK